MGQLSFTYQFPDNFHTKLVNFLRLNVSNTLAQKVAACSISYTDQGWAYYAGMKGNNWDKNALDFMIEGKQDNIKFLKNNTNQIKDSIQKVLKPDISGFLVRKVEFIIREDSFEISLPQETGEVFEVLSRDIYDALAKDEPSLVLDRLHTYSSKYLRNLCQKYFIDVSDAEGNYYPLHNLAGSLAKYYENNHVFQSDFIIRAMKSSISIFERFNAVRNDYSYAHDNDILNKAEATYIVTIITATLNLLNVVEKSNA